MNQAELIKGLVKVLREDIKKTLKAEIRNAVTEVLNEELNRTSTPIIKENYKAVSKDDGSWGEMRMNNRNVNPVQKPSFSPEMFGYDANAFGESSNMAENFSGNASVEQEARMVAHKNPEGVDALMKAMTRDYSQLVKKFKG